MFKTAQSFIFFLFFSIYLGFAASFAYFLFPPPAYAQERDLHNWTQNVMIEVMSSLTCQLVGVDPVNPSQKCLGIANGKIGPVDSTGGAVGVMGNLIAMTFTPPLHTGDYVKYLAGNFGITKPAYAQGIGFQGLSPLINIWTAFRNIAYLLFILIFVAIGFAIMLRVKIDPRTVMSIENQIPKIIIGLILVTFSFAIAGFLIDLMYVFIYLSINVFQTIPGVKDFSDAASKIQGENAIGVFDKFVGFQNVVTNSSGAVKDIVRDLFSTSYTSSNIPVLGFFINVGEVLSNFVAWFVGGVMGVLALIIISIAVLYALFRLWFTLIQAYIFILLDVVFAPFWIIAGLMPGSNLSFSTWLRDIGANLIAFPATIVMFLLANAFTNSASRGEKIFVPPLIGNANAPDVIEALIGLGIILMTPTVVNMMKAALKAPKIDIAAIARATGVGTGVTTGTAGQAIGTGYAYIAGALPQAGETGIRGVARRIFGRL